MVWIVSPSEYKSVCLDGSRLGFVVEDERIDSVSIEGEGHQGDMR
jgi:hypothetical protein